MKMAVKKSICGLIFFIGIWFTPQLVHADEKLIFDAQILEHRQGVTHLKDNVRFSIPGKFLITADEAIYNTQELNAELNGNVKIDYFAPAGTVEIASQHVLYNFATNTGVFTQVEARFGDSYQFVGEKIEIQEEDRFVIFQGLLTACNQANPQWSISIKKAILVREGYSKLKHATFSIKGVPVFYFPFLILPTMQERQTGLLLPETGNSQRNGNYLKMPIYIAPRQDWDMTLTPGYFRTSGVSLDAEVRYHTGLKKKGILSGFIVEDKVVKSNPSLEEAGRKLAENRFRFGFHHQQNLGRGTLLVDAEQGSDYQVEWDFVEDIYSGRSRDYFNRIWYGLEGTNQFFSLNMIENERIFADQTGFGEISHLPEIQWIIPTKHLGHGFFLKSNVHAGLIRHNYFNEDDPYSSFRFSLESEIKRSARLGSYLYANYGLSLLASHLEGDGDSPGRKPRIIAGTFELLGPKLFKTFRKGRFEQYISYGTSIRYNEIENPLMDINLEFDEIETLLGDQIDGWDPAWFVRSSLFHRGGGTSNPLLEIELRKKVNTDTRISPLELAVRVPGTHGLHFNSLIRYQTNTNEFDLLSFYGSVVKGHWTGYAGYVRRQTGENDQDSLILTSDVKFPQYKSYLHWAMDYDFLKQEFKSQELAYKLIGQCMGFQVAYHETPDAGGVETKKWYRLTLQFRNLGEVGSKF